MTTTAPRPTLRTTMASPVASYYLLVVASGILVLVGLAVVLSSTSINSLARSEGTDPWGEFMIQLSALGLGFGALAVGSRLSVVTWKRLTPAVLFASIGLLVLVLVSGTTSGGNTAWLILGNRSLQPSEIAKLALALYLGVVLSRTRHQLTNVKAILVPGGVAAATVIGLVLLGKDMGTSLVLMAITATAYWVAGLPVRFFAVGAVGLSLGLAAMVTMADSRVRRITDWLSEDCDTTTGCYQQLHGTRALGSGGIFGLGPGMSREKWGYLPHADNDYIFAILGEEWGLVGTLTVLLAFGLIVVAVHRIVRRSTDRFAQIAGAGLGAWIIGQAFLNIAVVLELAPVTGVALPLVSSGGSSLVMSLAAIGVLMALARHEPGAQEAFAARPSVMRKAAAVIGRRRG